jgi:hypothetical protein
MIVLYGKRIRKPKELDSTKPEYGNGNRCIIERHENTFFIGDKVCTSKYRVSIYETNTIWGISNYDWYLPITSLIQAQYFVENNFGGKWNFNKPKKFDKFAIDTQDIYSKYMTIYENVLEKSKSIEYLGKFDREMFDYINDNLIIAFNWLRNAVVKGREDEIRDRAYFVEKYLDDLMLLIT